MYKLKLMNIFLAVVSFLYLIFPISFLEVMNTTSDVCGKVCGNVGSLGSHKKAHEFGSTQGPLKCFICGKGYRSMGGLIYDKRNIHKSNVISYSYDRVLAQAASRKLEKEKHTCKYCADVHFQRNSKFTM